MSDKDCILIGSIILLIVLVMVFAGLFVREYLRNHKGSDANKSSDVAKELIGNASDKDVSDKDASENSAKTYGSGIMYNKQFTKFDITPKILPIVSEKLFDDDIVVNSMKALKSITSKNPDLEIEDETINHLKLLIHFYAVMNEYKKYYNNIISVKVTQLVTLYYSMLLGEMKGNYDNYRRIVSNISHIKKDERRIKICSRLLENEARIKKFVFDWDNLVECIDDFLESKTSDNWKNIVEIITKGKVSAELENVLLERSKGILSTDSLEGYTNQYYDILEYNRDDYVKDFKELFGEDIETVAEGSVYQMVDKYKNRNIFASDSTIFFEDDTLRSLYVDNRVSDNSTFVNDIITDELKQSDMDRLPFIELTYDHADVIPAAVVNAIIQCLVIKYIHHNYEFDKMNIEDNPYQNPFEKLFKVLLATRLNMTFINILANVSEERGFNAALSNSFHVGPPEEVV